MAHPLYPSLIPRYIDESWFSSDQPVDEVAKLNELEANHEVWAQEAHYRTVGVHAQHIQESTEEDGNEEDDEDDINDEDDDDDDAEDDMEADGLDDEDDFNQASPTSQQ